MKNVSKIRGKMFPGDRETHIGQTARGEKNEYENLE